MIGPCADPRRIKRGWNSVLFFQHSRQTIMSNPQNDNTTPFTTIEELRARRQAEKEEREQKQREEDEAFEEEIRRLAEEEERRKREEEEWRRKLEEAEREWLKQKELEKARKEKKRKVVESEGSGDEAGPSGSNKKVSK